MDSDNNEFLSDYSPVLNYSDDNENSKSENEDIANVRLWCRVDDNALQLTLPTFPFIGTPGMKATIPNLKEQTDFFFFMF